MQSLSSKIICAFLRAVGHSPFVNGAKTSDTVGKKTKNAKSRYKPSAEFELSRHKCGNCCYERLTNKNAKTDKVILHLHGGSFKVKLIDTYRKLSEKYSRLADGATVISPDYRTFPEFEHPAQLEDARDVYLELLKSGIKSESIIFIGDSAGANLAVTTALWLRDNGYPLPSQIICFSLWADMTSQNPSREKNAYSDPFGGIAKRKRTEDNLDYLHRISAYAKNINRESPYVSPVFAEFDGFPKTTLICAGGEMDEGDNDTVYEKMKAKGVDVKLYKYDGLWHCFQLLSFLPESRDAYNKVKYRIKEN